jgi:hypothetical protein
MTPDDVEELNGAAIARDALAVLAYIRDPATAGWARFTLDRNYGYDNFVHDLDAIQRAQRESLEHRGQPIRMDLTHPIQSFLIMLAAWGEVREVAESLAPDAARPPAATLH